MLKCFQIFFRGNNQIPEWAYLCDTWILNLVIMFGNQNNYQIQNLAIIMHHKDKPIPEFDYFLQRKNICAFWWSQINYYGI